jgi:hypothetical protein
MRHGSTVGFRIETFSDIVHCRSGSFLNLSLQSIILFKTLFPGQAVDLVRQFSRQLPCLNIFKMLDFHLFQPLNREPLNREPLNREPLNREPLNREPLNREPLNR